MIITGPSLCIMYTRIRYLHTHLHGNNHGFQVGVPRYLGPASFGKVQDTETKV